jgi:hypothetical protein
MNAVLLTGAGFSFNWGGKLAREVNTAVALHLKNDSYLADVLRRNPNFEEALTELQNESLTSARPGTVERLENLEAGIIHVFNEMNKHLAAAQFDFCPPDRNGKFSLAEFFDFIRCDFYPQSRFVSGIEISLSPRDYFPRRKPKMVWGERFASH